MALSKNRKKQTVCSVYFTAANDDIHVLNNHNSGCVQKFPFINYKIIFASRDKIHRHEALIRLLSDQKTRFKSNST